MWLQIATFEEGFSFLLSGYVNVAIACYCFGMAEITYTHDYPVADGTFPLPFWSILSFFQYLCNMI